MRHSPLGKSRSSSSSPPDWSTSRSPERLGLRLNTVRNHVQNILYKLQAHSKLEAVATAVRQGAIALPAGDMSDAESHL